ncbi:MAG: glycosyltransferase family 2 protein [Bacteroidota bacterium]
MRSISIPPSIRFYLDLLPASDTVCAEVNAAYHKNLLKGVPEVSIVIPAYNEEDSIVKTLYSLCLNNTGRSVEIIVVNNNSSDKTASLVNACGVTCIDEEKQGITMARNKGLSVARGTYILNADADTLYPLNWIEAMVNPLMDERVALTYGNFSFLPIGSTGRVTYFVYEYITDVVRALKKKYREEAVNVYGFNSGFRRQQGLEVEGFNHPPGTNEDGWLALKLRDKGFGRLKAIRAAPVWTTDRRLQIDGGFWKAIKKRIKRNI